MTGLIKIRDLAGEGLLELSSDRQLGAWLGANEKTVSWLTEHLGISNPTFAQYRRRAREGMSSPGDEKNRRGRPMPRRIARALFDLTGIEWEHVAD